MAGALAPSSGASGLELGSYVSAWPIGAQLVIAHECRHYEHSSLCNERSISGRNVCAWNPNIGSPMHLGPTSGGASSQQNPSSIQQAHSPATPVSGRPFSFKSAWSGMYSACKTGLRIILAVAALVATYIALSVALWTSAKDYRDDCRGQMVCQ